jgi:hypothetical protein
MSSEKRDQAQYTEHNLRQAEIHMGRAERAAQLTGDKSLVQKVTKIREAVTETRKDILKKLDNHSG